MLSVRTIRGSSSTTRINVSSRGFPSSDGGLLGCCQGQVYDDGQPAAWHVLGAQRAFHRLGEPASHCKSQAHSVTSTSIFQTPERGEDLLLQVVRDPDAAVDHPNLEPVADDAAAGHNLLASGGVPQSILQDVCQHPVEQAAVSTEQR